MNNNIKNNQTDDENEIKKFSEMASEWWNPKGKFAPLHHFNPVRLEYFVNQIKKHFSIAPDKQFPFKNLSILDVGCGGGLISEPMARLGGKVTGIDASLNNINVAKFHAKEMNLEINYLDVTPEKMTKSYDVILCLEIIEHVADVDFFIKSCEKLLKKNGIIIFSTLNRTIKSFLLAIIGAEYILNWLPKGTHSYDKFLKPEEIITNATKYNLSLNETMGFVYNIIFNEWRKSKDISVNYALSFTKN
jgi:2-polyprenyl-6-hydroxyphenyl methylase/3-demethylubiquinone-9 3-methyltransferase